MVPILNGQTRPPNEILVWQHRNLGKAFYENPGTQKQSVEEFRQALALAPDSAREQLNYGLALLRLGDTANGVAQLEKVQKLDPNLPHTWFSLGVTLQKQGDFDGAFVQFQRMVQLRPREPVSHYHLGTLYKLKNDVPVAVREFEIARGLDPKLAAPHFQLYGLYRQLNRLQEAETELQIFQDLKKQQEGATIPEDMDWSSYAEIYDPSEPAPSAPLSAPVYRSQQVAQGFAGPSGVAALLLDGGIRPSLIAWSASGVSVFKFGVQKVADSGLEDLRDIVSIAPGDFDNNGLPDLCVITSQAAWLYRNVNGKFRKEKELIKGSFQKALWIDYDHDYDLDLILIGNDSRLLRNNGSAGFSDESKRFPFVSGQGLDAVRFELEPDTPGFDIVATYRDRPGVLYRDRLSGSYEAVAPGTLPADAVARATAAPPQASVRAPVHADFGAKGRLDWAQVDSDGRLQIGRDVTPNYGNWLEVALVGVKSPVSALNAKIEVKAGDRYEKIIYEGIPVVFRLGDRRVVDTIRITWPNGLIQNEIKPPVNRILTIKEAPRLSGSCPMIFTWNGGNFQFITDVLGVAPLGASSGDGQYFPVDHDEYVSIPGDALKSRDGFYEVRFTEELREVSYIDEIQLLALDHPADTTVLTNEKFKAPPFPEFRLFGVEQKIYPLNARDSKGKNVLPALQKRDKVYPDSFRRDSAGVAEMHSLELDFGNAAPANHAALVLQGWLDWADGSTFLSAVQEHKDLTFPYLQVKDASGQWKTVIEDMGIPAGKPKTIVVDLTGKFLTSSREVRIVTNLCAYWDEIYLLDDTAPPQTRITPVQLASADLHFRGFSKPAIDPERKQPETFDYANVSPVSQWNPTPGNYTRYGPVETLLSDNDDRMVVMGSGDEIRLLFREAQLPDLTAGWKRDFLLLVDGWAKDADANTAFSQTVLPLPFHGMTSYPYPAGEHYPADVTHVDYQHEYNTRPALRLIRPLTE